MSPAQAARRDGPGGPRPPGPDDIFTINTDPESLAFLDRLVHQFPDIARVESADRADPSVVLNHPDLIRQVLVTNHENYIKGVGFERVRMLLGHGIIVSDGETWRRQRTMIQPGFSRSNIARLSVDIKRHTLAIRDDWDQRADAGEVIDVTSAMSHYALDVILHAIFSDDLDGMVREHGGNPFGFLADDQTRDLQTVLLFRKVRPAIERLIEARRASGARPPDFLSAMLDARDRKTGSGMSNEELLDEVATLIIAGHETSAGTLNWAWHLMAHHPEVEARLHAEVDQLPGDDELGFEDVVGMRYALQVLQETLRLYPPVWLFSRRSVGPDRFGEFGIDAGTHIFIAPYFLHRRPEWWPEPERFDPGRFEAADPERMQAFIPFSAGPRRCIGEYFSLVEMRIHLGILARRFRLRAVPGQRVELDPAINLRSRYNLHMALERREPR